MSKPQKPTPTSSLPDWIGRTLAREVKEQRAVVDQFKAEMRAELDAAVKATRDEMLVLTKTLNDTFTEIAESLASEIAAGIKGLQGEPGPAGKDGEPGKDGAPGRDGLPGLPGRDGLRGPQGEKGIDGKDGKDGKDGIVDLSILAEAHKGVWKPGAYPKGSQVTFAGSQFIALEDTEEKPETGKGWRLTVKRGRDGKDGINGKDGAPGPRGPMGSYKGVE